MQITSWQKQNLLVLSGFCIASFLLFGDILNAPFFSDDFSIVRRVSNGNFDAGIFLRPLGDMSLYIDWVLFGNKPYWFHFHNIVLHGLTSFFVVFTAHEVLKYCRFESKLSYSIVLFAGLLFLIYPFHAETIIWIAGRGIILSALWICLSIYFFCRQRNSVTGYVASLFCFVIALCGYETALILPLLIATMVYARYKSLRKMFLTGSGFMLIGVCFVFVRSQILGDRITGDEYFRLGYNFTRYGYNFTALVARSIVPPFQDSRVFVGVAGVFLALLLFLGCKIKMKQADVFFKALYLYIFFLISLVPLITVGIDTHDYEGGRFLYQSSIFFCLFVSFISFHVFQKIEGKYILIGVIGVAYIFNLQSIKADWKEAGKVITGILSQEIKLSERNYFFRVPDNKNGAYIFRNGLADAFILNRIMPSSDSIRVVTFEQERKNINKVAIFFKENKIDITSDWQLDTANGVLIKKQVERINLNSRSASVFIFRDNRFFRLYPTAGL